MALITSGALPPERMRIMAGKTTKEEQPSSATTVQVGDQATTVEGDVNVAIDWDKWPDRGPLTRDADDD
jgi:hypothetical protein